MWQRGRGGSPERFAQPDREVRAMRAARDVGRETNQNQQAQAPASRSATSVGKRNVTCPIESVQPGTVPPVTKKVPRRTTQQQMRYRKKRRSKGLKVTNLRGWGNRHVWSTSLPHISGGACNRLHPCPIQPKVCSSHPLNQGGACKQHNINNNLSYGKPRSKRSRRHARRWQAGLGRGLHNHAESREHKKTPSKIEKNTR